MSVETADTRRTLKHSAFVTVGMQLGRYSVGLVALVVLARVLLPSDYGVVTMAWAVVGLASVVGDLGLSLAALRAPLLTQGQKSNLFWINGAVGIAIGTIVAALAVPLSALYGEPRLVAVTLTMSSVFVMNGFSVQFKVEVNRARRFVALGLVDLCGQLAGLAVALLLAVLQFGYWALVLQQIVGAAVSLSIAIGGARWRPSLPRRGEAMRALLTFGRDTLALQSANYVTSNIDSVALGQQFGSAVLGIYNRAFQIVVLPLNQVMAPLTRVFVPYLADAHAAGELDSAVRRVQRRVVVIVVAPLGLLIVVATPLVSLVLGERWVASGPLISVLALGALFQGLGYVYYWTFLTLGRTGKLFASELWGRVPMVILVIVCAHEGSTWVAAIVSLGQFLIWLAGTVYYAPRAGIPVRPLLRDNAATLLAVGVATAIAALAAGLLRATPPLVQLATLTAAWTAVLFAVGGWSPAFRQAVGEAGRTVAGKLVPGGRPPGQRAE